MYKHLGTLAALGWITVLTACGGNSGGADAPTIINVVAEGAWSGTNSKNDSIDMLLLENGDLYAMFSGAATATAPVLAFDKGSYAVSASTLTAPVIQYNDNGTTVSGTLSATVQAGVSIIGSATNTASTAANLFSVIPTSAVHASYNYNTPAAISDIAGAWTGAYLLGQATPLAFSIDSAGVVAASDLACSFAGNITPRSSGKNVFDISLTFGPSPCPAAGKAVAGVAISYLASNGKRQFSAAMQGASGVFGSQLFAQR